jgi:prolyl-tRNA editing enzyme YbaK/EbsC (Cys-tRNA(Pro) deacylase)
LSRAIACAFVDCVLSAARLSVYVERTIGDLPRVYVNGGRRGYLVGMAPADLMRVLKPQLVDAAVASS